MKEVEDKVKNILQEIFPCIIEDNIDIVSATKEDIRNWDSHGTINLLVALEEEFDIEIPDEIALSLNSYPQITNYIIQIKSK